MTIGTPELRVGDGVIYRAYNGAEPEQGVVTEIREAGIMVRYDVLGPAKLTPPSMLERIGHSGS